MPFAEHLEGPGRIAKDWTDSQLEKMLLEINVGALPEFLNWSQFRGSNDKVPSTAFKKFVLCWSIIVATSVLDLSTPICHLKTVVGSFTRWSDDQTFAISGSLVIDQNKMIV